MNLKTTIFEVQRLLPNKEYTYMYGNVLVTHPEPIEMVGKFHKWKFSHKRRSYLIRVTKKKTSLFFPENTISLCSPE